MNEDSAAPAARRRFVTRTGLASFGALGGALGIALGKPKAAAARWEAARHEKDDWLDKLPGVHRLVFDTTTPDKIGEAMLFANNFMIVNAQDYGLKSGDLAVVIVARHFSTPFGYNDAMWAKYGTQLAAITKAEDPKTKQAPKVNYYNAAGPGGASIDTLGKLGVQIAVCAFATRFFAGLIAQQTGGDAKAVFEELTANLLANARMVPAGIVAVNRAQERGYALVSC